MEKIKNLGRIAGESERITTVRELPDVVPIASGRFGDVSVVEVVVEREKWNEEDGKMEVVRQKKLVMVKKEPRLQMFDGKETFDLGEIERQMEVHEALKKAGIPTFTTLRTDGEALYSTLLNTDGVVALSFNNGTPRKVEGGAYGEIEKRTLKIKNIEEVCKKIAHMAELAAHNGIDVGGADCLFFLVPERQGAGPVSIDVLVGDLDRVEKSDDEYEKLLREANKTLFYGFIQFVYGYVSKEEREEYADFIKNFIFESKLELPETELVSA